MNELKDCRSMSGLVASMQRP